MTNIDSEHVYNSTSDFNNVNVNDDVVLLVFFLIILACCICRCTSNGGIEGCLSGEPESMERAQIRARNRIAARRASADNFLL